MTRTPGGYSLGRASVLSLGGTAVFGVFDVALTIVIARFLGPSGSAPLFIAIAVYSIAVTVAQLGTETSLVRFLMPYRSTTVPILVAALGPVLCGSVLIGMVLLLTAAPLSELVTGGSDATPYIRVLAVAVPAGALLRATAAATRGLGAMAPTAWTERAGQAAARCGLVTVALVAGASPALLAAAWAVPVFLSLLGVSVWLFTAARRTTRTALSSTSIVPSRRLLHDFWSFTSARALATVMLGTIVWVDVPLVAALATPEQAGVYAIVSRTVLAGAVALRSVLQAIAPAIAAVVEDTPRLRVAYNQGMQLMVAVAFPFYLALLFLPDVLPAVFGPAFAEGRTALVILSAAMLLNAATGPISLVLLMLGRSIANLGNSAAALTLAVGLNVLLIPPFGLTGAALAWAVSIAVENIAPLIQLWRPLRLTPLGRGGILIAIIAAACYGTMGLAIDQLDFRTVVTIFALGVTATAAYLASLWALRTRIDLPSLSQAASRTGERPALEVPTA